MRRGQREGPHQSPLSSYFNCCDLWKYSLSQKTGKSQTLWPNTWDKFIGSGVKSSMWFLKNMKDFLQCGGFFPRRIMTWVFYIILNIMKHSNYSFTKKKLYSLQEDIWYSNYFIYNDLSKGESSFLQGLCLLPHPEERIEHSQSLFGQSINICLFLCLFQVSENCAIQKYQLKHQIESKLCFQDDRECNSQQKKIKHISPTNLISSSSSCCHYYFTTNRARLL